MILMCLLWVGLDQAGPGARTRTLFEIGILFGRRVLILVFAIKPFRALFHISIYSERIFYVFSVFVFAWLAGLCSDSVCCSSRPYTQRIVVWFCKCSSFCRKLGTKILYLAGIELLDFAARIARWKVALKRIWFLCRRT